MNAEQKKQVLVDSYNVLIKQNSEQLYNAGIHQLIGSVSAYDFDLAMELWKDAIEKHPENLHSCSSDNCVGWSTEYAIECEVGREKIYDYIVNDDFLKQKLFLESGTDVDNFAPIILYCFRKNDLLTASNLVELVKLNSYSDCSFGNFLDAIFFHNSEQPLPEDAIELLTKWCSQVDSEEERAALNVKLIRVMDAN